jgi:hypothetical protein
MDTPRPLGNHSTLSLAFQKTPTMVALQFPYYCFPLLLPNFTTLQPSPMFFPFGPDFCPATSTGFCPPPIVHYPTSPALRPISRVLLTRFGHQSVKISDHDPLTCSRGTGGTATSQEGFHPWSLHVHRRVIRTLDMTLQRCHRRSQARAAVGAGMDKPSKYCNRAVKSAVSSYFKVH